MPKATDHDLLIAIAERQKTILSRLDNIDLNLAKKSTELGRKTDTSEYNNFVGMMIDWKKIVDDRHINQDLRMQKVAGATGVVIALGAILLWIIDHIPNIIETLKR